MTEWIRNRKVALACSAGIIVACSAYAFAGVLTKSVADATSAELLRLPQKRNVVAVVDGQEIVETDLSPFLSAGVDRAVAVDRAINRAVAASLAEAMYTEQALSALANVKADVLASVFIKGRSTELSRAITEEEIKQFYDARVMDDDFTEYRLKFFITQDAREAQEAYEGAVRKEKHHLARYEVVERDGRRYIKADQVPYGLGAKLAGLQSGQLLPPLVTREGVVVIYVEDVKAVHRPPLESVREEIRTILVSRRLSEELKQRRSEVRVEISQS
ncbi:peptidyl-prolyl cis-trans isomerase [Noviherbaspirillum sp. CPCC 100848]|uniref:Peptidyl-prolyl cis-trans isomerase n=1 Tax=Noviherbaspirillum album TaxID=3080276 RepID=A0ABU6JB81_9BURK|nr:peptidyl-prolyl cis-trans isomerase [Noviherbaspirillum sp. CPCC 100848]MEC4720404.1 peptidyl-prolyl cis-trans isomerase [Noviherbaspirillum sp. CPCC 100848]